MTRAARLLKRALRPQKTAVISQRGMGQAIGFSRRGSRLGVFAASKQMEPYIGRELREKIENPIVFQRQDAAAGSVASKANGSALPPFRRSPGLGGVLAAERCISY